MLSAECNEFEKLRFHDSEFTSAFSIQQSEFLAPGGHNGSHVDRVLCCTPVGARRGGARRRPDGDRGQVAGRTAPLRARARRDLGRRARVAAAAAARRPQRGRPAARGRRVAVAGALCSGEDRRVDRRPFDQLRAGGHRSVRRAAVVADARRRVDRDIGALRPLRLSSPPSSGSGRRADPVAADAARRADAEPGRRRALRAAQRAEHRHQSRRAAAADARGPGAQGAAGPAEPARRLQPAQSELADVGRQSAEAGVDLPPVGRLRRSRAPRTPAGS